MRLDESLWDAVIVGAGPAGGVSAALLAERGWRVLLVERARWPREKICGGCVNAAAVEMLRDIGMDDVITGAKSLNHFSVHLGKKNLTLTLPEGVAISRDELDQRIVAEAVRRGATFLSGASAALVQSPGGDLRQLIVTASDQTVTVKTRVLLAADGIAGTLLEHEPWAKWRIARNSYFGVATTLENGQTPDGFAPKENIGMHVGIGGYVGTARYADGRVHIAAALHPEICKQHGGPALLVEKILRQSSHEKMPPLNQARFRGTGLLTRRRAAVGGHRVLAVGDACGYVEPFTGEGIAWAIRGAREAVELLIETANPQHTWHSDIPAIWTARYRTSVGSRQRWCRTLRQLVRQPLLAQSTLALVNCIPAMRDMAEMLAQKLGAPSFGAIRCAQGVLNDQS